MSTINIFLPIVEFAREFSTARLFLLPEYQIQLATMTQQLLGDTRV